MEKSEIMKQHISNYSNCIHHNNFDFTIRLKVSFMFNSVYPKEHILFFPLVSCDLSPTPRVSDFVTNYASLTYMQYISTFSRKLISLTRRSPDIWITVLPSTMLVSRRPKVENNLEVNSHQLSKIKTNLKSCKYCYIYFKCFDISMREAPWSNGQSSQWASVCVVWNQNPCSLFTPDFTFLFLFI